MVKIKCKLKYRQLRTTKITVFAKGVSNGIFNNNPPFITPPGTQAVLDALIQTYETKYGNFLLHKVPFSEVDEARDLLIAGLEPYRAYVDTEANGNPTIIALAAFEPTKGSKSKLVAPVQPTGGKLERGIQDELLAECDPIANADSYGAILSTQPLPAWFTINGFGQVIVEQGNTPGPVPPSAPSAGSIGAILDLTKPRKKKFSNLQVGVTYYVYFWAINAGGVSPLSEAVSKKVIEL